MGTRYNLLGEAVLTSTHNLCFKHKCEKYQNFYLRTSGFLVVKISIYLNRRVFVMGLDFRICSPSFFWPQHVSKHIYQLHLTLG